MATIYLKQGLNYTVNDTASLVPYESLPVGTYAVGYDDQSGQFFLTVVSDLSVGNGRIYGETPEYAKRIFNTYLSRDQATGVLLTGEQGSGKTLLSKLLSIKAREFGMSTIVVNQPWAGEKFNKFVQSISQPTVMIFDEFEKVYDEDDQPKMLTLLDGVYPTKKLFILTTNDSQRVNSHMINRPGRLFYRINYAGLSARFIREYCEDVLAKPEHTDTIVNFSSIFRAFNFDMLKALVEEMNRYDETPEVAAQLLNAKPDDNVWDRFEVRLHAVEGIIKPEALLHKVEQLKPLTTPFTIYYNLNNEKDSDGDLEYNWQEEFRPTDIVKMDADSGTFEFKNAEGARVWLTRYRPEKADYWGAF